MDDQLAEDKDAGLASWWPRTERPEPASPRSAALLLTDALAHLDLIEPPGAREPIRQMFRAGIEQCAISRTLLGKPLNHVLALAQALIDDDIINDDEGRGGHPSPGPTGDREGAAARGPYENRSIPE